jgi:hypothetical protein
MVAASPERDCFVAEPVLGRRAAPTRGLLAIDAVVLNYSIGMKSEWRILPST